MPQNNDKQKVFVTFGHTDRAGEYHEVGTTYELQGDEYRARINDRFVLDAASEPAKAAAKDVAKAETAK